tara:strand:+ start:7306 stop:7500 length:195 start_codon:yes stop_codon:yes gene_type:complete
MIRVQQGKLDQNWMHFTNSIEEQRLIILEIRIERKKRILEDAVRERQLIMARAIKRMRRAEGKK